MGTIFPQPWMLTGGTRQRLDELAGRGWRLVLAPGVLRLSYVADIEPAALVEARLAALQTQITEAWEAMNCCYALAIEPEVFWRLGAPPEQPVVRVPEGR